MKLEFHPFGILSLAFLYAISCIFEFLDPVRTPIFIALFFAHVININLFRTDKSFTVNGRTVAITSNISISWWLAMIACTYFFSLPWDTSYSKTEQIVILIAGMIVEIIYKSLWRKKQIKEVDEVFKRYEEEYKLYSSVGDDVEISSRDNLVEYEYCEESPSGLTYKVKKSYYKF